MSRFVYDMHRTTSAPDSSNGWKPWMTDAPKSEARPRIACSQCFAMYAPHLLSEASKCIDCR